MIDVDGLVKRYGEVAAVDGISFRIAPGEVVGLLGPNGAGKSTTMRLLVGFLAPDAGRVSLGGRRVDPDDPASRRALGYLPESTPLYPRMRVRAFLAFAAELRGLRGRERAAAVERVLGDCDLAGFEERRIGTLSKGYRQRVGLAQALIGDPDVLVLDEPTSALDPSEITRIRALVRELARRKTIVLSTHVLSEVQELCRRVIILAGGRVVADGSTAALAAEEPVELVLVLGGVRAPERALEVVRAVGGVRAVRPLGSDGDGRLRLALEVDEPFAVAARVAGAVGAAGLALFELRHELPSLERVFLTRVERGARGAEAPRP